MAAMSNLNTMDAIETLARFIESQAAKDIVESGAGLDAMAAEFCTTRDVMIRALQVAITVSALIDSLDWPLDTKLACREFLATLGQRDLAWMAGLRRRQKALN
jgi:hypothetical protein